MRNFLQQTAASLLGTLVAIALMLGLGLGAIVILVAVASTAGEREPELDRDSVLAFDLSAAIVDSPPVLGRGDAINEALSGDRPSVLTLRTVLDTLDRAAEDDRIAALYLESKGGETEAGFATLRAVRQAIAEFRESGKRVVAYGDFWSERTLYLASAANERAIDPFGSLEWNGFSSETTFFGPAFDRYGIEVQVVRAGRYKAAVEPFIQGERSPESREQLQQLLSDLWTETLTVTASGVGASPAELAAIANERGVLRAEEAVAADLFDRAAYEDEAIEGFGFAPNGDEEDDEDEDDEETADFRRVELSEYARIVKTDRANQSTLGLESAADADEETEGNAEDDSEEDDAEKGDGTGDLEARRLTLEPPRAIVAARTDLGAIARSDEGGADSGTPDSENPDSGDSKSDSKSGAAQEESSNESQNESQGKDSSPENTPDNAQNESANETEDEPPQISPKDGARIAVVYAEGAIVDGQGGPGQVGSQRIVDRLEDLREDDRVRAVVLRVNSPGGSASASEAIHRELVRLREADKPVVVSMGDTAASGGYWIATASDRILAEPTTVTGSIGVFGLLPNVQELGNNNGIRWDAVKTSPLADADSITRPRTPEELAIFQESVNWTYDRFLERVAESRGLSRNRVDELGQGRVWSGQAALRLGLVDALGGLEAAVVAAAELAELDPDAGWTLQELPDRDPLERRLLDLLSGSRWTESLAARLLPEAALSDATWEAAARSPLGRQLQAIQADAQFLLSFDDPAGLYAKMPYRLRVD